MVLPLSRAPLLIALSVLFGCTGPDPGAGTPLAADDWSAEVDLSESRFDWLAKREGEAAVPGRFEQIRGGLMLTAADLDATTGTLHFGLARAGSGVELRDERIGRLLFGGVAEAELQVVSVQADRRVLDIGEQSRASVALDLRVGRGAQRLTAEVRFERPDADTWVLHLDEPLRLSILGLGLGGGLGKLLEACGTAAVEDGVAIEGHAVFRAAAR